MLGQEGSACWGVVSRRKNGDCVEVKEGGAVVGGREDIGGWNVNCGTFSTIFVYPV